MSDEMEKVERVLRRLLSSRNPEHEEAMRRLKETRANLNELLSRQEERKQEERQRPDSDDPLRRLEATVERALAEPRRLTVNKRTHRIRFESESETEVTIVIEKHEDSNDAERR